MNPITLKSDLRGIETVMSLRMTKLLRLGLKSDLRGIETSTMIRSMIRSLGLKSDLRGIETYDYNPVFNSCK